MHVYVPKAHDNKLNAKFIYGSDHNITEIYAILRGLRVSRKITLADVDLLKIIRITCYTI